MKYNHRNLEHLISILREPSKKQARQKDFNEKRLARIEKAVATRPVYIPLFFDLAAESKTSAYQEETPDLRYDVIVTGIIANDSEKEIVIRESIQDSINFVAVGQKKNLRLKLSDLSGGSEDALNGRKGIFTLPCPIVIKSGNKLYIDIYKTTATDLPEKLEITLIGQRVSNSYALNDEQRKSILAAISKRDSPKMVIVKQIITYDSENAGERLRNEYTPKVEEPLLVRGVRSTFRHSLVNLGIESDPNWTVKDTPAYAIFGKIDDEQDSYLMFERPIFIDSLIVIDTNFENYSATQPLDAQVNEISWLCETM